MRIDQAALLENRTSKLGRIIYIVGRMHVRMDQAILEKVE